MEDSAIVNKSSVDRGLMNGCFYRSEKAELDKGEVFGNPDYTKTTDIKKSANYGFVENGFVREGTIVKAGDVLIVKTGTIAQPTDDYQFVDKSITYKAMDQAIVERVIVTFNNEDKNIAKVKLRAPRNLGIGDKLCLTPDHEVLVKGRGFVSIGSVTTDDLVYTVNANEGFYERPSSVHVYQHSGMVVANSFAVMTPEHKVPIVTSGGVVLVPAGALVGTTQLGIPGMPLMGAKTKTPVYSRFISALLAYGVVTSHSAITVDPAAFRWVDTVPDLNWVVGPAGTRVYSGEAIAISLLETSDLTELPLDLDSRAVIEVFFAASRTIRVTGRLSESLQVHIAHMGMGIVASNNTITLSAGVKFNEFKPTVYTGTVHCVTVSSGMFLTRYRGRLHVTGNSSRNGNKAIVAALWPEADMPYDENGVTPDIIINPHGIPSRMVVGQLIETLEAEYAVHEGVFIESSPFRTIDIKHIMKLLETKFGIKYGGHRRLFNGKTGNWLDTLIFMGPVGYQRLQKFVVDESYAVATGPSSSLERQPLDGRSNEGGLRLGEMECWVLASHSSMRAWNHKIYDHSDYIELFICRNCGQRAVVNEKLGLFKCKSCKSDADIVAVNSSWCCNILVHELNSMNIGFNMEVEPYAYSRDMEPKK